MIILFLASYILFIFADFVPIKNKKQPTLLWLYSTTMSLSVLISMAISLGLNVPSPAAFIEKVVRIFVDK